MKRYKTGAVKYMKVVSPEGGSCVLPGQESYDEYMAHRNRPKLVKRVYFGFVAPHTLQFIVIMQHKILGTKISVHLHICSLAIMQLSQ